MKYKAIVSLLLTSITCIGMEYTEVNQQQQNIVAVAVANNGSVAFAHPANFEGTSNIHIGGIHTTVVQQSQQQQLLTQNQSVTNSAFELEDANSEEEDNNNNSPTSVELKFNEEFDVMVECFDNKETTQFLEENGISAVILSKCAVRFTRKRGVKQKLTQDLRFFFGKTVVSKN